MKVRMKLVPDAEPNADGEWKCVDVDISLRPQFERFRTAVVALAHKVPRGYHIVAYSTRLQGYMISGQVSQMTRYLQTMPKAE